MSNYGADQPPDTNRIRQVAFAYGLAPLAKLKVDQFPTDSDRKAYHLVVKVGSTNLHVLVDPAAIPN